MRISFCRLLSVALLLIAAAGCAKQYETAIIEDSNPQTGGQFAGLAGALEKNSSISVFWTHGMCSHDDGWVNKRSNLLREVLSAEMTEIGPQPAAYSKTDDEPRDAYVRSRRFVAAGKTLDVRFMVWSPLTKPYKANLYFDAPQSKDHPKGEFPYERAKLNGQLKVGLMNDCLVDAVVYSGPNGNSIRVAMRKAVCGAMGGQLEGEDFCRFPDALPNTPLIFVSESLGSKFLLDALRALRNSADQKSRSGLPSQLQAFDARLADLQIMFMLANQVPLLDQADGDKATPSQAGRGSVYSLLDMRNAATTNMQIMSRRPPTREPLLIVAFTDPNDLLSYRLDLKKLHNVQSSNTRLINVISSNAGTLLGYVEHPADAHCGYEWNHEVVDILVNGYDGKPRGKPKKRDAAGECFD